jgi:glucokinase
MSTPAQPHSAVGIDFGGTTVKIGLIAEGRIIEKRPPLQTQSYAGAPPLINAMVREVEAIRAAHPELPAVALGVGMPGFVDSDSGIVHSLTNVRGWKLVPLRDILQERTGLPSALENDAKSMSYAEWRHGAAKGKRNVVCITLGTGVGGGLILDGRLYRGSAFGAGEVGQMSLDSEGNAGHYGNHGALEKYVGNAQIVERAMEMYAAGLQGAPEGEMSPFTLQQAAQRGDPVAIALWQEIGGRIGFMLSNIVWLLNPDTIVIGGGVAKAGEWIFGPVRAEIKSRCSPVFWQKLDIVPALLGSDAGLIGAATLGLDIAQGRT